MALFRELRFIEARALALEIGAGILPVLIEKQLVEPAVEIVMMRRVAAGFRDVIALGEAAQRIADPVPGSEARRID